MGLEEQYPNLFRYFKSEQQTGSFPAGLGGAVLNNAGAIIDTLDPRGTPDELEDARHTPRAESALEHFVNSYPDEHSGRLLAALDSIVGDKYAAKEEAIESDDINIRDQYSELHDEYYDFVESLSDPTIRTALIEHFSDTDLNEITKEAVEEFFIAHEMSLNQTLVLEAKDIKIDDDNGHGTRAIFNSGVWNSGENINPQIHQYGGQFFLVLEGPDYNTQGRFAILLDENVGTVYKTGSANEPFEPGQKIDRPERAINALSELVRDGEFLNIVETARQQIETSPTHHTTGTAPSFTAISPEYTVQTNCDGRLAHAAGVQKKAEIVTSCENSYDKNGEGPVQPNTPAPLPEPN